MDLGERGQMDVGLLLFLVPCTKVPDMLLTSRQSGLMDKDVPRCDTWYHLLGGVQGDIWHLETAAC